MKKDKLKMKPTLKEKRHYLVVELLSGERLNEGQAKGFVDSAVLEFIGKLGYASAGPLYFGFHDVKENKAFRGNKDKTVNSKDALQDTSMRPFRYRYLLLVSVLTKYVDYIKTSLTLFSDKSIKVKCIGVSGTIIKAKRFLK